MFGATAAQYVKTPMFVLNSKYDTWQEKAILGVNQTISKLPASQQRFWVDYGQEMVAKAQSLPPQHGVFLTNCPEHCQTGDPHWVKRSVNGSTIGASVLAWYEAHTGSRHDSTGSHRWIETCDITTCGHDTC